jgi:hypothetical protein
MILLHRTTSILLHNTSFSRFVVRAQNITTTAHFVGSGRFQAVSPSDLESTRSTLLMSDQTLGRVRGGADKYCMTDPGTLLSILSIRVDTILWYLLCISTCSLSQSILPDQSVTTASIASGCRLGRVRARAVEGRSSCRQLSACAGLHAEGMAERRRRDRQHLAACELR